MSRGINGIGINHGDEYYTPLHIVKYFGKFDYDPATTPEKAEEFGITNFDTKESDGLTKDWTVFKRIWINPPFTRKTEFLSKAWETYKECRNEIYLLLPIGFLTTNQFLSTVSGGHIYIPNHRINFEHKYTEKSSPSMGSVIVKIQDSWECEFITKENLKRAE